MAVTVITLQKNHKARDDKKNGPHRSAGRIRKT